MTHPHACQTPSALPRGQPLRAGHTRLGAGPRTWVVLERGGFEPCQPPKARWLGGPHTVSALGGPYDTHTRILQL